MGADKSAATLYTTAMNLSRTAFAGRHYAVAYHGLAAALHAAYDLGDDERLAEVGETCAEQNDWLDKHEPYHELSMRSAASRGTHNLWTSLQHEVRTRRQILHQHHVMD